MATSDNSDAAADASQLPTQTQPLPAVLLGLDIGTVRIGVALGRSDVRLAQPLTTLQNHDDVLGTITRLAAEEQAGAIVAGWPRGLAGQATDQTGLVEAFAERLRTASHLPVYLQDEALTSRQAEAELEGRGKPYRKEDVDALAATYILQDFLEEYARPEAPRV